MEKIERKARGERIRQIRLGLDLNQEAFGHKLGLKTSTISGYEAGDAEPKPGTLAAIAALGEKSLDWLITGKEPGAGNGEAQAIQRGEVAASIEPGGMSARDRLIKQRAAALKGEATGTKTPQETPPHDDKATGRERGEIDPKMGSRIAFRVLSSQTSYAGALWENLISFERAVEREEEMESMKGMMVEMMEKIDRLERRIAEKGASEKRERRAAS